MIRRRPQTSFSVRTEGGPRRWRAVVLSNAILIAFACTLTPLVSGGCSGPTRFSTWFDPGWSPAVIAEANMARARMLSNPRYIARPAAPIRYGPCGMPAPVVLKGLRTSPPLEFSPAAIIARPTAETLNAWHEHVVQPAAWRTLGAPVTRITLMGSYNCRNRNSSPFERLSGHAYGAAVDVSGFVTARGDRITVRDYWRRPGPASAFLHRVLHGACGPFGMVLGPDSNSLHYNHFHLEVRSRGKPYCR
jgi:hypothetical protein